MTAGFNSILCGLSGAENAQQILPWVVETVDGTSALVIAVHVITPSNAFMKDLSVEGLTTWRRKLESQLKHDWLTAVQARGLRVIARVVHGEAVATGLLRVADEFQPDVIVVGAAQHAHVAPPVGQRLAQLARQPVVVIPRHWKSASEPTTAAQSA